MQPDLALTYCRIIADTLSLDDAGQTALLANTGMDASTLNDGDGFLDWAGTQQLINNALALDSRPDLALQTGMRALPAVHGPMGMAAMASPTLGDAMQLFATFMNTRTRIFSTTIERQGASLALHLNFAYPPCPAIRFLTESAIASAYACYAVLRGTPITDGEVHFPFAPPDNLGLYDAHFPHVRKVFNAPGAALVVSLSHANTPLPGYDQALWQMALQQCEARQRALQEYGAVTQHVSRLLAKEPVQVSLEDIAEQLHISPRTLIRKLKNEGARFQQLRDQELSRRASEMLQAPQYTIAAVSEALGYTDVASFRRAFQRWFGLSPSDFRKGTKE